MKEIKIRRIRFLAMLLGLVVLINTPAISVYAEDLYLGSVYLDNSGISRAKNKHIKPGEKISWEIYGRTNTYTVTYLDAAGQEIYSHEEESSHNNNGTAGTMEYQVLSVGRMADIVNRPKEPDYWILTNVEIDNDIVSSITLTAGYGEEQSGGSGDHEHHFEWIVTREATEDDGGIEEYKCECGKILYTAPISAEGVFIKNTINKIINAPAGAAVEITTEKWLFFNTGVCDALSTRPDITLKINYREEGHKGTKLSTVIPKGKDLHKYLNEDGYVGFLYLRTLFPTTVNQ